MAGEAVVENSIAPLPNLISGQELRCLRSVGRIGARLRPGCCDHYINRGPIATRFGVLHILVNNAGIPASAGKWEEINRKAQARLEEVSSEGVVQTEWDITQELSDDEWHRMIAVHLNGTFFCTREALKIMSRQNGGVIINISSVAALKGLDVSSHYAAAKGGILAFTRSLAQELASRNIQVNAICPGFVNPAFNDPISPRLKSLFLTQIPLGRSATARDIALTALFLVSDEASYYTGQWLSPNGGIFIA